MHIAILSDIHANLAALEAVQEPYDFLLCLGDLVDYGPQPREAIRWVRDRAFIVIRGNHDQALAYDMDCGCAPVMKEASLLHASGTLRFFQPRTSNTCASFPLARASSWAELRSFSPMPLLLAISTNTCALRLLTRCWKKKFGVLTLTLS